MTPLVPVSEGASYAQALGEASSGGVGSRSITGGIRIGRASYVGWGQIATQALRDEHAMAQASTSGTSNAQGWVASGPPAIDEYGWFAGSEPLAWFDGSGEMVFTLEPGTRLRVTVLNDEAGNAFLTLDDQAGASTTLQLYGGQWMRFDQSSFDRWFAARAAAGWSGPAAPAPPPPAEPPLGALALADSAPVDAGATPSSAARTGGRQSVGAVRAHGAPPPAALPWSPGEGGTAPAFTGERPVNPEWIAAREAAFAEIRVDFAAHVQAAMARVGHAPGWRPMVPRVPGDEAGSGRVEGDDAAIASGRLVVRLLDDALSASLPGQPGYAWHTDDNNNRYFGPSPGAELAGDGTLATSRWFVFDSEVAAADFRTRAYGSLWNLAGLYGTDPATLFTREPSLWSLALDPHDPLAGAVPAPGVAMAHPDAIAMLDVVLNRPDVRGAIDLVGGNPPPLDRSLGAEYTRIYGERRARELSRYHHALHVLREGFSQAVASQFGPFYRESAVEPGALLATIGDLRGVDAFSRAYAASPEPVHRLFDALMGEARAVETDVGDPHSGSRMEVSHIAFTRSSFVLAFNVGRGQWEWRHPALELIDPNAPPDIRDWTSATTGFFPEAGWATLSSNINRNQSRDWVGMVASAGIQVLIGYVTFGTGNAAAGTLVGAIAEATGSVALATGFGHLAAATLSELMSGDLDLRNVVRNAFTQWAGAELARGLNEWVAAQAAGDPTTFDRFSQALVRTGGRVSIATGIAALLGGDPRSAATGALSLALAQEVGRAFANEVSIGDPARPAESLEQSGLRLAKQVIEAAIVAAFNPADPSQAFARTVLRDIAGAFPGDAPTDIAAGGGAGAPPNAPPAPAATPSVSTPAPSVPPQRVETVFDDGSVLTVEPTAGGGSRMWVQGADGSQASRQYDAAGAMVGERIWTIDAVSGTRALEFRDGAGVVVGRIEHGYDAAPRHFILDITRGEHDEVDSETFARSGVDPELTALTIAQGAAPADALLSPREREYRRILDERHRPTHVDDSGRLAFFDLNRDGIVRHGAVDVTTAMRDDGVTVTEVRAGGRLLGVDYGAPSDYRPADGASVGGDPVASLRRQVSLPREHADLASRYIDPGSGQVDPARWNEFLAETRARNIRIAVTSNGIDNSYQQAADNARLLASGRDDTMWINVLNPTSGSATMDVVEAARTVMGGETQAAQVAIRNQLRQAIEYNGQIDLQVRGGVTDDPPTPTTFVGHSQGSINGNAAIVEMRIGDQANVRLVNVGTYAIGYPPIVGQYINITDVNDLAYWAVSGGLYWDPEFDGSNPSRRFIRTDIQSVMPNDYGNSHSLYLYLRLADVQSALGMMRAPENLTAPFVTGR